MRIQLISNICAVTDVPLYAVKIDVQSAFDNVSLSSLFHCLLAQLDMPLSSTHAILKCHMMRSVRVDTLELFAETDVFSGIAQGVSDSAILFMIVHNFVLSDLEKEWHRLDMGVLINGVLVFSITQIDDTLLLATSLAHIQYMTTSSFCIRQQYAPLLATLPKGAQTGGPENLRHAQHRMSDAMTVLTCNLNVHHVTLMHPTHLLTFAMCMP